MNGEELTHEEAFAPWQTEGLPPVPGPSNGTNLIGGHCKVSSELGCQRCLQMFRRRENFGGRGMKQPDGQITDHPNLSRSSRA